MVVGAVRLEPVAVVDELGSERLRVGDDLPSVCLPGRRRSLLESGCNTGDGLRGMSINFNQTDPPGDRLTLL